jgi:hypothetical protein
MYTQLPTTGIFQARAVFCGMSGLETQIDLEVATIASNDFSNINTKTATWKDTFLEDGWIVDADMNSSQMAFWSTTDGHAWAALLVVDRSSANLVTAEIRKPIFFAYVKQDRGLRMDDAQELNDADLYGVIIATIQSNAIADLTITINTNPANVSSVPFELRGGYVINGDNTGTRTVTGRVRDQAGNDMSRTWDLALLLSSWAPMRVQFYDVPQRDAELQTCVVDPVLVYTLLASAAAKVFTVAVLYKIKGRGLNVKVPTVSGSVTAGAMTFNTVVNKLTCVPRTAA